MAVSRPEPGPFTKTSTLRMPCSCALRAAFSAAICAANGVDLREPLKPTWPAEAQLITLPLGSVMDTIVLLNVLLMCAAPWATFFFSLRRTFLAPAAVRALGGMSLRVLDVSVAWPRRPVLCERAGRRGVPRGRCPRGGPRGPLIRAAHSVGARGRSPVGLLLAGLLLAGAGLARALAGARVGLGALPVAGKSTAVTQPLVAADLHLAADVAGHLAAQVTLDAEVLVDVVAQLQQVLVAEVLDAQVGADARRRQRLLGGRLADAIDVGECDLHPLPGGEVDTSQSCHVQVLPQPWRCLCRALSQMTMTRPCRRITLHLSQILFTDGWTFTGAAPHSCRSCAGPALPWAVADAAITCSGRRCDRGSGRRARAPRPRGP